MTISIYLAGQGKDQYNTKTMTTKALQTELTKLQTWLDNNKNSFIGWGLVACRKGAIIKELKERGILQ